MKIKHALGRAAAIAAAATGLAALGLTGVASASTSPAAVPAAAASVVCTIQAFDGHYLSAIGGGGRTTDVIHATQASTWETFTCHSGDASPSVTDRTTTGIPDDRAPACDPKCHTLVPLGPGGGSSGVYAIQTIDGHYLTAVNSGGIGSAVEAIHSNATQIQAWERFFISCH